MNPRVEEVPTGVGPCLLYQVAWDGLLVQEVLLLSFHHESSVCGAWLPFGVAIKGPLLTHATVLRRVPMLGSPQMPIMDGLEATQAIRQLEMEDTVRQYVPIIGLTAHAMQGYKEKCLLSGMDGYATKPFKIEQLASTISSTLAHASGGVPAPAPPHG